MTRYKHVLVLIILILPVFALVPTLVTSPNGTLMSQAKVDTSLPAQFVEETLRVAVYAESNLTLPAYATGGVYTDHYQNVIDLLESAGYAVTAMSTQDILDHKLMVADYDAFVLPNQLPRESIINHIKDYWLGGGGILCFDAAVGYLFYAGIIDQSSEGNFNLYPIDISGDWTYAGLTGPNVPYDGIYLNQRNPVTKSLVEDTVYPFTGNQTLLGGFDLAPLLGARFLELGYYVGEPTWTSIAGFDNPDRGGRIVYMTGNCSSFETWMEPVAADAIDWLTPRPKARILYDLTHMPYYGVDSWDISYVQAATTQIDMRGLLVNRTYTFDKLYPPNTLSLQNLDGYDILVVCDTSTNFTASEVSAVTAWVNAGGSILAIADHTISNNQNMNYLLSNMDIALNLTAVGTNNLVPSGIHPTHEDTSAMSCLAPGAVAIAGSAFPLWEDASNIPVIGGDEHGNGRIILIADGAIMRDVRIDVLDNAQALINFANWLSAATAKILVYADTNANVLHPNFVPINGPVCEALRGLGEQFYLTSLPDYFNMSLYGDDWDMVVFDNNMHDTIAYQPHLIDYLEGGGKVIFNTWELDATTGAYFGVESNFGYGSPPSVYIWDTGHPMFNLPVDYGADNISSALNIYGVEALNFTTYANATSLAGYDVADGGVAIALGVNGRVIVNGPTWVIYNEDTDDSTYPDNVELWTNQIGWLYYDRPTIDSPADVTYMQTETGNEITWTPIADAGPWEFVFRVNGTPVQDSQWTGAPLTFNVDGVNVSITEYELTVFDRLGYSVSDLVILNVTEYIAPGPGPFDIDPMLLLVIGGAIAGVVIILVIFMKRGKKE